jgi:hypothetical protein
MSAGKLPWLEAMSPRSAWASSSPKPPVRMAFLHVPNGIVTRRLDGQTVLNASSTPEGRLVWQPGRGNPHPVLPAWTPEEVGALPRQLPPLLEALADFRDDFSVITGLADATGRAGVGHGPAQRHRRHRRPRTVAGHLLGAGGLLKLADAELGRMDNLPAGGSARRQMESRRLWRGKGRADTPHDD